MKSKINNYKKFVGLLFIITALFINSSFAAAPATVKQQAVKPAQKTASTTVSALKVDPVAVVNNPAFYLNKSITFEAQFVAFSALGLDYKPALKSSNDYIGILIQRTDVKDHVIPLSEMKIFLKRDEAEKHVDLEQGDKIKITGTVFSTALGDPWVDIKTFSVLESKQKKQN